MERFIIPDKNPYQENARAFLQSQRGKQLRERYTVKPYEEQYAPLYHLAVTISYIANLVSIVTASTWLFTWVFAIVHQLPYPSILASIVSITFLILLEWGQRFFAERYFRKRVPFGYTEQTKKDLNGLCLAMLLCAGVSICFSFLGSFDVVTTITSPPTYQAPPLLDVASVTKRYQTMVNEAEQTATDYYNRRKYRNRIATEDAKKYQSYLDKKIAYQDSLLAAVTITENINTQRISQAKQQHQAALKEYEQSKEQKGSGLGVVAIVCSLLFYLSMWYQEWYYFQTIAQYAVLQSATSSSINTTPPAPTTSKDEHTATLESYIQQLNEQIEQLKQPPSPPPPFSKNGQSQLNSSSTQLPIGFFNANERERQIKNLFIQHIQPYKQRLSDTMTKYADKYTIAHTNLKNGRLEHLDIGTVNNRANIYIHKIEQSLQQQKFTTAQRQLSMLHYWLNKRQELVTKMEQMEVE